MSITAYRELEVLAEDGERDERGLRRLTVRVLGSPVGPGEKVERKLDARSATKLTALLEALDARDLDVEGVIGLGEALADLLLPADVRSRLVRSLDVLRPDEGLRLRLRLDPLLADVPWEYAFVPRQAGQRDATGFLALDPQVSIVRDQPVDGALKVDERPRDRRIVVAMASPDAPGLGTLNLAGEQAYIEAALNGVPGVSAEFVPDATMADLSDALSEGATDVFHFAGHGVADSLVLQGTNGDGAAWRLPAAQLAVNLRSRGTQLAVLGACETGRRDGENVWSGVVTRLVSVGIPAAVAMQYRIADGNAIEFGSALYRALAAGLPIDHAVSAGRLAVFNRVTGGRQDAKKLRFWRDWGVPVLYLAPDATVSLASVADPKAREALVDEVEVNIRARVGQIGKSGNFVGPDLGTIESGRINVRVTTKDVLGTATIARAGDVVGGTTDIDYEGGDIDGEVVVFKADTIGGRTRRPRRRKEP